MLNLCLAVVMAAGIFVGMLYIFSPSHQFFFKTSLLNNIWLKLLILDLAHPLGGTQLHNCPVQPYIPIYLIVLGLTGILSLVLTYFASTRKSRQSCIMTSAALCVVHFFNFCWLVAGRGEHDNCATSKMQLIVHLHCSWYKIYFL